MDCLKEILPRRIFEVVDRAEICTPKQIMILSIWDIKKKTGLRAFDIQLLKNIVAGSLSSRSMTCNKLLKTRVDKIKTGCMSVDNLLNGGFRRGVLTEIYGESASGKTQLSMQIAANNASHGSVYICTEDVFPVKRYNQIQGIISAPGQNLSNNVYVEQVYEVPDLLSCVRLRLPRLLQKHKISVVIIDSVAAPFRCESTNYMQRADELRELATLLIRIAQDHNLAVICINQVTASFDDCCNKLLPSLGLAWSNMISCRLWLKKLTSDNSDYNPNNINEKSILRQLTTIFAPDLPNDSCRFTITSKGITDLCLKQC